MPRDRVKPLPSASRKDTMRTLSKAAVSAIPIVGGPASVLFDLVVADPLALRRDGWLESIAERLDLLEARRGDFSVASLKGNEQFISALLRATPMALRTHHADKRNAMRNAVLNVAIGADPGEDIDSVFLNLIDTLSVWHLRTLVLMKRKGPDVLKGSFAYDVIESLPAEQPQAALGNKIIADLLVQGLLREDKPYEGYEPEDPDFRTKLFLTQFGEQFLEFISSPIDPASP